MTDQLPAQIGKYRIVELVGEGAMGTVYRAVDSVIGRTVAVKVMNASIARQQDHRQRFLREAQAAGSLQHPNVVTIYDMGEIDGHLFIAMEFVHGSDLERLMELSEPLKLQAKLDIIIDVLTGLSYAHKKGIVHRDIKPANIRVEDDGRAKIMDFGVAHLASSDMTRTGLVVGTPSYMAPEQVTGGKAVPGTDLFAVGAVLYHLLSGSKPFEGPTLQSLFYKIVTDMPEPLTEIMPGLPPALDRITRKALAKDPDARYRDALDMANELSAVRAELSGGPYPVAVSLPTPHSTPALPAPPVVPALPAPQPKPARRTLVIAGGSAAAALLVGWLAFGQRSDRNEPASGSPRSAEVAPAASVPDSVSIPAPAVEQQGAVAPPAAAPATAPPPEPTSARTRRETAPAARPSRTPDRRTAAAASPPRRSTAATVSPPAAQQPTVVQPLRESSVATAPPVTAPQRIVERAPDPLPAPPAAPPGEVAGTVAAYARAIESRDIAAIRRIYPGLTADQARGFEQFFQSARSINVTFRVAGLETSGNSADARLVGTYEYVTTAGRTERQPVSFAATLRHDGTSWRLTSVR